MEKKFIGLNSSFTVSQYELERDVILNSNAIYLRILQKKKGFKIWLKYHRFFIDCFDLKIYYSTFTFKNEKLDNLNMKSFCRYLIRNGVLAYRLNYDKGDLNERLHLHGFIITKNCIDNYSLSRYGFTKMIDVTAKTIEEEEDIINYIVNYVIKNKYFCEKVFTKYIKGVYNESGSTSYNIY